KHNMDLYYSPLSGSSPAILMTAQALGLKLNLKVINVAAKEQLKPEFTKINPQHTVPTLVDNDFVLWESRAILGYLVDKYGKTDSLYPKDPKKRAVVNQRLFFDMGTLYQTASDYYFPQMHKQPADPEKFKKVEEALEFLDAFLEGKLYLVGDNVTIADFTIWSTVSAFTVLKLDISKYSNIVRWLENGKKTEPGWQEIENAKSA
ncbi:hypothetical protein KR222_011531, partial [Zaprionus bogoriensis]